MSSRNRYRKSERASKVLVNIRYHILTLKRTKTYYHTIKKTQVKRTKLDITILERL